MRVNINIKNAVKRFGKNTIIPDLSLEVHNGEFFTLLGPSGCGKTTLLRMIAGFNTIEDGDFFFNDLRINDLDPSKRKIGMVFQNYAIFPHLSVRKNVAFGLSKKKFDKDQIANLTDEFMKLVHVEEYAERIPERLSGGQQQRVALARALVISPDVLLMDEPLSNLDAKLRVEMRGVIKKIQKDVGITTIYVTHDQEEAMAVSDRIAVMSAGVIQHIGKPKNVYLRPANVFVANFIGRTNMLKGKLIIKTKKSYLQLCGGFEIEIEGIRSECMNDQDVQISIRPEEFILYDGNEQGLEGTVTNNTFLGLNTHYNVLLPTGEEVEIIQESSLQSNIEEGMKVSLQIKREKINVFTADGSENILLGVQNDNKN